jgi:hypothetical protein
MLTSSQTPTIRRQRPDIHQTNHPDAPANPPLRSHCRHRRPPPTPANRLLNQRSLPLKNKAVSYWGELAYCCAAAVSGCYTPVGRDEYDEGWGGGGVDVGEGEERGDGAS